MRYRLCLLAVALLLRLNRACMNIPEYFGALKSSLEIYGSTLGSSATSCNCCGLCHQHAACKSFSFGRDSKECILYNKVGSYGELSREKQNDHNTQFFFKPGKSLTNEFCRSDSDCITDGDFCRGRICTTDITVTCRDVFDQNNDLPDHRYWGFIDGRELPLYCRMGNGFKGATLLLSFQYPATDGEKWSYENILNKTYEKEGYPNESQDYSILGYSDIIRDSRIGQKYEVNVIAYKYGNAKTDHKSFVASKSLSLKSTEIVPLSSGSFTTYPLHDNDERYLAFPHVKIDCHKTLYSATTDQCSFYRSLVEKWGTPWWPISTGRDKIVMFILE